MDEGEGVRVGSERERVEGGRRSKEEVKLDGCWVMMLKCGDERDEEDGWRCRRRERQKEADTAIFPFLSYSFLLLFLFPFFHFVCVHENLTLAPVKYILFPIFCYISSTIR